MTRPDTESLTRRIAATVPRGEAMTVRECSDAVQLLADMLDAAEQHGITLEAFDWVTDLPAACLKAVRAKARTPHADPQD